MDQGSPTLGERVRTTLGGRGDIGAGPRPEDLTVRLHRASEVADAAIELKRLGLSLATLVATDERSSADADLKVRYLFDPGRGGDLGPLEDTFVTLVASLDPGAPEVPSITSEIPAANWHEREAQDLFGIVFLDHPEPKPLVVHDGWPKGHFPLRKDFDPARRLPVEPAEEFPHLVVEGEGVLEVPVGPIHAGIIEPGHFRFSTVGEAILHLEARLFYTHRGLEKRLEGLTVPDAFYVVERICGVCALSHGLGFAEAVERIAAVRVPDRARYLRTIALELERLYNHVGDIGNICAGASYHYGTSAGARMKEALQQACERLSGSRFLRDLVVPGGVRGDLTPELERSLRAVIGATDEALASLMDRIDNNPSFLDRCVATGRLELGPAVELGVTGVGARASGVDRDARRDHPHAAYAGRGAPVVNVVTVEEGDVMARLNVRAGEARESMRLLRLLLDGIPEGALAVPLPEAMPPGAIAVSAIESPRGAAIHWVRTDGAGRIDRYHLRSASYANWPAVVVAAQPEIIPDFPIVNKSFELCYSCTDR